MAKTILFASGPFLFTSIYNGYFHVVGSLQYNTSGYAPDKFYSAGTITNLQITVSANAQSGNVNFTLYKSGGGATLTATILAGQTGFFEDASGSASIAANESVGYNLNNTTGEDITLVHAQSTFAATTNTVSKLGVSQEMSTTNYIAASTSFFWPLGGQTGILSTEATEASCKTRMRKAGTFKTLRAGTFNYGTSNQTVALRKNGADAFTVTVLAGTSGYTENNSSTSTCAVDDDFNFAAHIDTDPNCTIIGIHTEFETTDNSGVLVAGNALNSVYIKNTTNYTGIGGIPVVGTTTESFAQTKAKEAYTFSNLEGYVTANASDQGGSVTLMKGGVDTALTFSTGNQLTGLLQNTSNTVTTTSTDLLDLRVINLDTSGGAHSITFRWIAMFYSVGEAPPAPTAELLPSQSHANIHQSFDNRRGNVIGTIFGNMYVYQNIIPRKILEAIKNNSTTDVGTKNRLENIFGANREEYYRKKRIGIQENIRRGILPQGLDRTHTHRLTVYDNKSLWNYYTGKIIEDYMEPHESATRYPKKLFTRDLEKIRHVFHDNLKRESFDNENARVEAFLKFGVDYDNAYWDGEYLVFGEGDNVYFNDFSQDFTVVSHELGHAVTQYESNLVYENQSGALNEHMSDVLGICLFQKKYNLTVNTSEWIVGPKVFTRKINAKGLRSFKDEPAYNDPVIGGIDDQPKHMKDYQNLPNNESGDYGGVHINSGIPNHAFYLYNLKLGKDTKTWQNGSLDIWYNSNLKTFGLPYNASFKQFANKTIEVANYLEKDSKKVEEAWKDVGIL